MSEAVDCALQQKDFRFASLVAQAASHNVAFKRHVQRQLQQWKRPVGPISSGASFGANFGVSNSAFGAINTYRQHVYHILSGEIEEYAAVSDHYIDFTDRSLFISSGANLLDWKRGFGLYFWYGVGQDQDTPQDLTSALRLYEAAFQRCRLLICDCSFLTW